jgi:hypothetical protein
MCSLASSQVGRYLHFHGDGVPQNRRKADDSYRGTVVVGKS